MKREEALILIASLDDAIKADDQKAAITAVAAIGADVLANLGSIAESLRTLAYVEHKRAEKDGVL